VSVFGRPFKKKQSPRPLTPAVSADRIIKGTTMKFKGTRLRWQMTGESGGGFEFKMEYNGVWYRRPFFYSEMESIIASGAAEFDYLGPAKCPECGK
jgi:hypothetical protein